MGRTTNERRPWLLLDVDGPLNPYLASWHGPYAKEIRGEDPELMLPGDWQMHRLRTFNVALSAQLGADLMELTEVVDLAWATTWEHSANRLISPILGLPTDLPVIHFPRNATGWWQMDEQHPQTYFKTRHVRDWILGPGGGRPFVWVDDEITDADRQIFLDDSRFTRPGRRDGTAWELLTIDPETGLTDGHLDQVYDFARAGA